MQIFGYDSNMTEPSYLETPQGRRIAYHLTPGKGPGIVFLGGFRSDMTGSKAMYLEEQAKAEGRAFLRFDYSGHGASSGAFEAGCIGDWLADAKAALALTRGPQVLIGSSMGGWMALLLARSIPERVAGLVGVAAAPDFTEDLMWATASAAERAELVEKGRIVQPSDYDPAGYPITLKLIEEGRQNLILRDPLHLPMPVRLLQGSADTDVPMAHAQRLFDHAAGPDIRLTLIRGGDHRLSTPECLALIWETARGLPAP